MTTTTLMYLLPLKNYTKIFMRIILWFAIGGTSLYIQWLIISYLEWYCFPALMAEGLIVYAIFHKSTYRDDDYDEEKEWANHIRKKHEAKIEGDFWENSERPYINKN